MMQLGLFRERVRLGLGLFRESVNLGLRLAANNTLYLFIFIAIFSLTFLFSLCFVSANFCALISEILQ